MFYTRSDFGDEMTLECDKCSATEFRKINSTEYKCLYCGSVKFFIHGQDLSTGREYKFEKRNKGKVSVLLISFLLLFVFGFLYSFLSFESNVDGPSQIAKENPVVSSGSSLEVPSIPNIRVYDNIDSKSVSSLEGEFSNVSQIFDSIGNVYFVGIYKNTSPIPIRKPDITIVLYSNTAKKVAVGRGYAIRSFLLPGEETPIRVLVRKPPAYVEYKVKLDPSPVYSSQNLERPKMEFKATELSQNTYNLYQVKGEIYNNNKRTVKYIRLIAVLYDDTGKIVGAGTGFVKEKKIEPNDYSIFGIRISAVSGVPSRFELDYNTRFE